MFVTTSLQQKVWLCFDNISSLSLLYCLVVLLGCKDHTELRLRCQPSLSPAGQLFWYI